MKNAIEILEQKNEIIYSEIGTLEKTIEILHHKGVDAIQDKIKILNDLYDEIEQAVELLQEKRNS